MSCCLCRLIQLVSVAMKTCRITDVPQVGSSDTIYDPAYLQPKIFQLSSVSRIFQQYGQAGSHCF
jgi:hypothetical protein